MVPHNNGILMRSVLCYCDNPSRVGKRIQGMIAVPATVCVFLYGEPFLLSTRSQFRVNGDWGTIIGIPIVIRDGCNKNHCLDLSRDSLIAVAVAEELSRSNRA